VAEAKLHQGSIDTGRGGASGSALRIHLERSWIDAGHNSQLSVLVGGETLLQHENDCAGANCSVTRTDSSGYLASFFTTLANALWALSWTSSWAFLGSFSPSGCFSASASQS